MATLARADISAAMSLILQDPMVDQFRRDVILLHLLAVKPGRNDVLAWNPKFTGRTAGGAYAEGADMVDGDFDSHTRKKATLNWAEYRAGAKVSGLAMAVTGAGGYTGNGDLFDEELRDAIDKMAIDVGSDLYAGDPGASPIEVAGAALAIDSAGTFAGLDPGTYTEWVAGENTLPIASLSFDEIRTKLIRPVKDATGRDPDFVTVTGTQFDALKALASDAGMDAVITEVRTADGGTLDLKRAAGANAIELDGVPFIEDRHCTASTMYAWTARDVEIVQVPAMTPARDPARVAAAIKALTGVDTQPSEVEMRMRRQGVVVPTIEFLAQTGDAYKAMVKVYLQLKWRTRRGFAKLTLT